MSIKDNDIWVLTDQEVLFYNTFFAFVAIILAAGAAVSFVIDTPIKIRKSAMIRASVLNDQRVLNWAFVAWSSKLALCFGLYFGQTSGFYTFSLYPDYIFMFVLFVVVLYIQLWTNARRFFKNITVKLMLGLGILITLFAFLLGSINLIDYKTINENILKNNVNDNYKIEKPEASSFRLQNAWVEFYLAPKAISNLDGPDLVFDNHIVEVSDIDSIMSKVKLQSHRGYLQPIRLNIHNTVDMKYVNALRQGIIKTGFNILGYSVVPKEAEYDHAFYKNHMIVEKLISLKHLEQLGSKPISSLTNIVEIKLSQDSVYLNGKVLQTALLAASVKETINVYSYDVVKFEYHEDNSFQEYITVLDAIRQAIFELRDEYSLKIYGKGYDYQTRETRKQIRKKYPMAIDEEELNERGEPSFF